jgi:prepilin-type processing-associated H-X9-DG protein
MLEPGGAESWVRPDGELALNPQTGCGPFALYGDASYTYSGYAVPEDNRFLLGWPGFDPTDQSGIPDVIRAIEPMFLDPVDDQVLNHPELGQVPVLRLREGIERFFITDINNPAAGTMAASSFAAQWDNLSATAADFNHLPGGSNVLYLDGHAEFVKWPAETYPVNPYMAFITQAAS